MKRIRNDGRMMRKYKVPRKFIEEVRALRDKADTVLAANDLNDLHQLRGRVLALDEILSMIVEE